MKALTFGDALAALKQGKRVARELTEITKQRDDLLESLKEVMPYIVGDRCVPWKKAQDAIDRATEGGAA